MRITLLGVSLLAVPVLALPVGSTRQESQGPTVASQPPVVVETVPRAGTTDVDPDLKEIRVTFSKKMSDGGWSWSTAWKDSTPEFVGKPRYENDGRTCVARVKLEPGRTYGFWLNSANFGNFKDADGRSAIPYQLVFETKPDKSARSDKADKRGKKTR